MLDLLIRNGLVIDGSGNPGYYATVGVEGDTLRILRGDTSALPAARTIDAGRARRRARLHRHALPRGPGDPARAASRAEGAPGRHHRAHRHRRQLARAVQDARGSPSLHRAGLRAQRRAADAGGLAHRGRAAVDVRQQGRGQHLLHPRQLARAHLVGGLGRPPGHAGRARRHEVRASGRSARRERSACPPASTTRPDRTPTPTS